jgi:two-component system sensor histidine kinase DevS
VVVSTTRQPETLAEAKETVRRQEAELQDLRWQITELHRELEDTNRGLIALYTELEDARHAEARLAAIVTSSDDAIISMTPQQVIQTWNSGAQRLLGHTAAQIVGKPAEVLFPEESRELFEDTLEQIESGVHAEAYDTRWRRSDGGLVDVAVTVSTMRDGDGALIGYSTMGRDITQRLAAQAALAAARADREVVADRERIARDLHDMVIQRVFGAGLTLQGVVAMVTDPKARERIGAAIAELDLTIQELRNAIFELHHRPTEATSLRARILELTGTAQRGLGFTPTVSFDGSADAAVPDDIADHVLAVLREALSNITRHAHASAVEVSLHVGTELRLLVTDNGRGLGQAAHTGGLANLRQRAHNLGGTFDVAGRPGAGTRLHWQIPLRPVGPAQ